MAQVTLNKDSWHFKYYSLIVSDNPPKSLCPYFWTMVPLLLLSPVIGLIVVLFFIHKHVTSFFDSIVPKKVKKEKTFEDLEREHKEWKIRSEKREKTWQNIGNKFAWVLKFVVLPLLMIYLVYMIYKMGIKLGWDRFFIYLGLAIVFILILIGLIYVIETYGGRVGKFVLNFLKPFNPLNWKVTKICGEMIVATYTKMCPIITWEDKTNTAGSFSELEKRRRGRSKY